MRVAFAAFICLSTFVILAFCVLWIKDKIIAKLSEKNSKKDVKSLASLRIERVKDLLTPDWAFYEKHLQRSVPPALKYLYSQSELILSQNLEITDQDSISAFEPITENNLLDTQEVLGFDIVPIATTDVGDPIFLRPGSSESDSVYIVHHDGGDIETIASSVSDFAASITVSE